MKIGIDFKIKALKLWGYTKLIKNNKPYAHQLSLGLIWFQLFIKE